MPSGSSRLRALHPLLTFLCLFLSLFLSYFLSFFLLSGKWKQLPYPSQHVSYRKSLSKSSISLYDSYVKYRSELRFSNYSFEFNQFCLLLESQYICIYLDDSYISTSVFSLSKNVHLILLIFRSSQCYNAQLMFLLL